MQATQEIHVELVGLEKRYWNAIKAKDASTAASLSHDPCVVVGAQDGRMGAHRAQGRDERDDVGGGQQQVRADTDAKPEGLGHGVQ